MGLFKISLIMWYIACCHIGYGSMSSYIYNIVLMSHITIKLVTFHFLKIYSLDKYFVTSYVAEVQLLTFDFHNDVYGWANVIIYVGIVCHIHYYCTQQM